MTILKNEPPYWFLYEGTPGGKLDEDATRSNPMLTEEFYFGGGDLGLSASKADPTLRRGQRAGRLLELPAEKDASDITTKKIDPAT